MGLLTKIILGIFFLFLVIFHKTYRKGLRKIFNYIIAGLVGGVVALRLNNIPYNSDNIIFTSLLIFMIFVLVNEKFLKKEG